MSTVLVAGPEGGRTLPARQLASLTRYVKNVQFRLLVTQTEGDALPVVTQRSTGYRVCALTYSEIQQNRSDYKEAAKDAFARLVNRVGEDKVFDVLHGAEIAAENQGA